MTTAATAKDYLEIVDLQARLRISNPTARALAAQLGRKVGRGWRVSAEKLRRYIEGGDATNTGSIKTSAASGDAISTPSQTDASSVLAKRPIARRRRSGVPRSPAMRGARRGLGKRRQ